MLLCLLRTALLCLLVGWLGVRSADAQLRLAGIFSDSMVLQRDQPLTVWGWAEPEQKVLVQFGDQAVNTVCDAEGAWQVTLAPLGVSSQGQPLTVRSGDNTLTLQDVVVGDVWHASGQSNMAMTVAAVAQRLDAAKQHMAAADLPNIRFRRVHGNAAQEPLPDMPVADGWTVCSPQTVQAFSAAAFYFARQLHQQLEVPIGIIDTSRGGTPIEPYIADQAFQSHATLQREWELGEQEDLQGIWELPGGVRARDENWLPSRLFHSRVAPFTKFSLRGTIWYQGESNCGVGEDPRDYQHKQRALISGWRAAFGDEAMPFYFVQLPGSGAGPGWPYLREQQRLSCGLPHTGMVVTIDLLDGDIHPPNKIDVGKRLARWALADTYGRDVVASGPMFLRADLQGATATVHFSHCDGGLVLAVKTGLDEPQPMPDANLAHFEVADPQGAWHAANARIDGQTVRVECDTVQQIVAVRYGYDVNPQHCHLYNQAGLPAAPFCSDPSLLEYDPGIPVAKLGLTEQIDLLVQQRWQQQQVSPAARCSDREFVRRVYLDLVGRIPTVAETTTFLADGRSERRSHLIDTLLSSEDYVQHFADLMDALLMGRGKEHEYAQRKKHGWRAYLERVFRDDRPWDQVSQEILLARPETQQQQGAAWFLYERNNAHQAIAEAIAPAFFGIRIECAQCHDHMMADEIKQDHYWGLVAFYNRGKNQETKNGPRVAEAAVGGFSEFANIHGDSSPNLLSFLAAPTVDEPRPGKDDKPADEDKLYSAPAVEGDPRVPLFSRREKFVEQVVEGHPLIARAMVNRLWAMLMGRGIVHPFDEMDSVHEPSHPELLDALAEDFAAHGYRIRRLVGAIARSQAYQLASVAPRGVDDPATFAWYLERPLTAEALTRSIQLVLRGAFRNDAAIVADVRQQLTDVLPDESVVTVSDALFLSNHQPLQAYIDASLEPEHLIPALVELPTHEDRVHKLFQTSFGRPPDASETAAVIAYLEQRDDDLQAALTQVSWSLLMSAEFRFNH